MNIKGLRSLPTLRSTSFTNLKKYIFSLTSLLGSKCDFFYLDVQERDSQWLHQGDQAPESV